MRQTSAISAGKVSQYCICFTNNVTVALIAPRRFLSTVDNPDKEQQICVCVNQVQTGDEKKPCEESEVRLGSVGGTEPVI